MLTKPQWCRDNCPIGKHHKAQGFALDSGNQARARLLCIWEAPGAEEVDQREAAVGGTGQAFNGWARKLGIPRSDILVANTIRCRWGQNEFPGEPLRAQAVAACRHWDRKILEYDPDVWGVTFHPASCFRVPQWRLYVVRAMEKALEYREAGRRPALLMGAEAMSAFMPHLKGGVDRWKCHFEEFTYGDRFAPAKKRGVFG